MHANAEGTTRPACRASGRDRAPAPGHVFWPLVGGQVSRLTHLLATAARHYGTIDPSLSWTGAATPKTGRWRQIGRVRRPIVRPPRGTACNFDRRGPRRAAKRVRVSSTLGAVGAQHRIMRRLGDFHAVRSEWFAGSLQECRQGSCARVVAHRELRDGPGDQVRGRCA